MTLSLHVVGQELLKSLQWCQNECSTRKIASIMTKILYFPWLHRGKSMCPDSNLFNKSHWFKFSFDVTSDLPQKVNVLHQWSLNRMYDENDEESLQWQRLVWWRKLHYPLGTVTYIPTGKLQHQEKKTSLGQNPIRPSKFIQFQSPASVVHYTHTLVSSILLVLCIQFWFVRTMKSG